MTPFHLSIINHNDSPIYELTHLLLDDTLPFFINSSLDLIPYSNDNYLHKIDSINSLILYCYVTQSNIKLILVLNREINCKQFFQEIHDLYIKQLFNPFYSLNDALSSPLFDLGVRICVKKYL